MRFGKTLRESIYPEWQDQYMDYAKLKSMLREDRQDDDQPWTEEDENRFCDEIFAVGMAPDLRRLRGSPGAAHGGTGAKSVVMALSLPGSSASTRPVRSTRSRSPISISITGAIWCPGCGARWRGRGCGA